jgi:hypothetical protein
MSCRHDLALGTCKFCYPVTGTIVPDAITAPNLDGPGAIPAPELAVKLRDWTDFDVAGFHVGQALGLIPGGSWEDIVLKGDLKGIFWSNNLGGNALGEVLDRMTELGALEKNEEDQFRWNPEFGGLK